MLQGLDIWEILKAVPAVIIGLTIHEWAHAFVAYKCGDLTAKTDGRMSLNPLVHIDPIGFLLIVVAGFGWAKPVQINPDNFRSKHRDEIFVSLAGPVSNLLLGLLTFVVARILFNFEWFNSTEDGVAVINYCLFFGMMNFGLFVFNMLPIPPLDGSHLYLTFVGKLNPVLMHNIYKYGSLALLVIIVLDSRTEWNLLPIQPILKAMTAWLVGVLGFN